MYTPQVPQRRRRVEYSPTQNSQIYNNYAPINPELLNINWDMDELDGATSQEAQSPNSQQAQSSESPMISNVRTEYQQMTQTGRAVIQRYTGNVNLNLEIVDLYDLTYDDNNNKIEGIDNVNNFLNHSPDNIVFLFENNLFFSSKTFVTKALNDKTMIKIGCRNADGRLGPQNLIKDKPYLMLKPIGLYGGLITVLQSFGIILGNNRFFHVSKTSETLASTVSLDVLDGGNRVSASHCQEGQSEIVYNLEYIELPTTTAMEVTGGKKKRKTRKERKSRKGRKTRKGKRVRKTRRRIRK
jgi:hypothetical protein